MLIGALDIYGEDKYLGNNRIFQNSKFFIGYNSLDLGDHMSQEIERLSLLTNMQQSESALHWSRNNYFLTCSSILMVAFSLLDVKLFRILIACLGFILNFAWLLIQFRSSKYILYWKDEANKLSSSIMVPSIYPKEIGGIEMRKVVFILPVAFMVVWFIIMIALIIHG